MASKTYDGQPLGVPAYTTDSDGSVRIEYMRTGEEDLPYTTMAPKMAGRYTVRIRTAESDTYLAASAQVETEILLRDVTIRAAALTDKNAGTGKAVNFTGFAVTGADAGNYRLTGQPAPGSVDMAPRTLTVTNLTVGDKEYDAPTPPSWPGPRLWRDWWTGSR